MQRKDRAMPNTDKLRREIADARVELVNLRTRYDARRIEEEDARELVRVQRRMIQDTEDRLDSLRNELQGLQTALEAKLDPRLAAYGEWVDHDEKVQKMTEKLTLWAGGTQ